ncbi:MAG: S1-like domain-containing RNA-binding protein [Rikenellaceae bacterium]
MIRAGVKHTLTVNRISDFGLYLANEEGDEVLLPNRYISLTQQEGDQVEVFVYHDSEDRLVATTEEPAGKVGEVAYMKVVDKNLHGAFLDWGLYGKDLFLPNRNQQGGVMVGNYCAVYLYEDNITGRCVATQKIKNYVFNEDIMISPRDEVSVLVASESEIGFRCVINNRYWGMLYRNQLFRPVKLGDKLQAYVRRITEDNRIDLTLSQQGYKEVKNSAEVLLDLLNDNGGELPINDNSAPERVAQLTQMSKKLFKRSLGVLLKRGEVEMTDKGIRVVKGGK